MSDDEKLIKYYQHKIADLLQENAKLKLALQKHENRIQDNARVLQ